MDLLKKRLDIARLVAEELTGTIDEKNRIVLSRWLDEDERHRKEYTNILESLKTGNEVWKDQERGRQLMESRWRAVKSHTVRKTGRWITWSKYAAVVLLFGSIGIFWLVNDVLLPEMKRGDEEVVLSPNQQAIWSDDKFKVKQVDARNYVLWKEGIFYFEDVDLERILDDMARWYNVNIFYMNSTLKKMKFSVEIKRYEDINEILRRIEQTKRVKFEIKDRTINVYE